MTCNFVSGIEVWGAGASWHFVRMPKSMYEDIHEIGSHLRKGFGSVRVEATIGNTTWKTSLFPDSKTKTYILFLKKAVRAAEQIDTNSKPEVSLVILEL